MLHVLKGGTDTASMMLFDPATLPDDFDEKSKAEGIELFEKLQQAGRLWWTGTDGDGRYLLNLYVDESPPTRFAPALRDPITISAFKVPGGMLVFAGAEYAYRTDDSFLRKHSHMGEAASVPAGTYTLTMHRTEYPEDEIELKFRTMVSPWRFRLHQRFGLLIMAALVGVILGSLWWFTTITAQSRVMAAAIAALAVAIPIFAHRSRPFRETDKIWRELELDYPSMVGELRRSSPRDSH